MILARSGFLIGACSLVRNRLTSGIGSLVRSPASLKIEAYTYLPRQCSAESSASTPSPGGRCKFADSQKALMTGLAASTKVRTHPSDLPSGKESVMTIIGLPRSETFSVALVTLST